MVVEIGKKINEMEFEAFHENNIKKLSFEQFKGKWLILFFYPGDFTFVCPTELEEISDLYEEFKKNNSEVISFSTDSVFVHKAWHDNSPSVSKIKFPMGADPSGKISREFNVYVENEGVARRGSFIIDPDGILIAYEVNDNSIGRNAAELLRKLQAAIFVREHKGEVCPASWKPGKKTIKPGLNLVGKI
ncbi:MAG: redoxin domain-containing protein [Candidatus Pacearchaeota archaeon]